MAFMCAHLRLQIDTCSFRCGKNDSMCMDKTIQPSKIHALYSRGNIQQQKLCHSSSIEFVQVQPAYMIPSAHLTFQLFKSCQLHKTWGKLQIHIKHKIKCQKQQHILLSFLCWSVARRRIYTSTCADGLWGFETLGQTNTCTDTAVASLNLQRSTTRALHLNKRIQQTEKKSQPWLSI